MPQEFLDKVQESVTESWDLPEQKVKVFAEGRLYPEEILVRIGILEAGRLAQANFEISMEIDKKTPLTEQLTLCFDASYSVASEYVQAGENANVHLYPTYWKELKFQGKSVFFQFSTVNSVLEAEADKLLGVQTGLFNEAEGADVDVDDLIEQLESQSQTDPNSDLH